MVNWFCRTGRYAIRLSKTMAPGQSAARLVVIVHVCGGSTPGRAGDLLFVQSFGAEQAAPESGHCEQNIGKLGTVDFVQDQEE